MLEMFKPFEAIGRKSGFKVSIEEWNGIQTTLENSAHNRIASIQPVKSGLGAVKDKGGDKRGVLPASSSYVSQTESKSSESPHVISARRSAFRYQQQALGRDAKQCPELGWLPEGLLHNLDSVYTNVFRDGKQAKAKDPPTDVEWMIGASTLPNEGAYLMMHNLYRKYRQEVVDVTTKWANTAAVDPHFSPREKSLIAEMPAKFNVLLSPRASAESDGYFTFFPLLTRSSIHMIKQRFELVPDAMEEVSLDGCCSVVLHIYDD